MATVNLRWQSLLFFKNDIHPSDFIHRINVSGSKMHEILLLSNQNPHFGISFIIVLSVEN